MKNPIHQSFIKSDNQSDFIFPVKSSFRDTFIHNGEIKQIVNAPKVEQDIIVIPNGWDKGYRVQTASEKYNLIPVKDIFKSIEQDIFPEFKNFGISKEQIKFDGFVQNWSKFKFDYKIDNPNFVKEIQKGDILKPMVSVIHSYDKSSKLGFEICWYRLICKNGLIRREIVGTATTFVHNENALSSFIYEMKNSLNKLLLSTQHLKYAEMAERQMNIDDAIEVIKTMKSEFKNFPSRGLIKIQDEEIISLADSFVAKHNNENKILRVETSANSIYQAINAVIMSDDRKVPFEDKFQQDVFLLDYMYNNVH